MEQLKCIQYATSCVVNLTLFSKNIFYKDQKIYFIFFLFLRSCQLVKRTLTDHVGSKNSVLIKVFKYGRII